MLSQSHARNVFLTDGYLTLAYSPAHGLASQLCRKCSTHPNLRLEFSNFPGPLHTTRVFHPWGKIFKGEIEIWRVKIKVPRVTTFNTIFPSPFAVPSRRLHFQLMFLGPSPWSLHCPGLFESLILTQPPQTRFSSCRPGQGPGLYICMSLE